MKYRPCIDLKQGEVVQIVGGSLNDLDQNRTRVNFKSDKKSEAFAELYRHHQLKGGHVISLGPGNTSAAQAALAAYPGGLQYGGGVNLDNACQWLDAGASHVIVTSFVFREGQLDQQRLQDLAKKVGKERLVLDLSCRKKNGHYFIVTDRWQNFTSLEITAQTLSDLSQYCDEFLVHGADVEGLRSGMEDQLIATLGAHCPIPVTYAGGATSLADLEKTKKLGKNKVDLTIGSALDIFGGSLPHRDVISWNEQQDIA